MRRFFTLELQVKHFIMQSEINQGLQMTIVVREDYNG